MNNIFLVLFFINVCLAQEIKLLKRIDCRKIKILSGILDLGRNQRLVKFSPDNKYLASASDCVVALWDAKKFNLIWQGKRVGRGKRRKLGFKWGCFALDFSPDGKYIVACGHAQYAEQGDLQIGSAEDGRVIDSVNRGRREFVRYSPDGKFIASARGNEIDIYIWDEEKLKLKLFKTLKGHELRITCLDFSNDSKLLASGSEDKTVLIWDIKKWSIKKTLSNFRTQINSLCFSPNNKFLAIAEYANTVHIFDLEKLAVVDKFKEKRLFGLFSVAFSPDSRLVALGTGNGKIKIYDLEGKKCISTLEAHKMKVHSVTFSSDGKYIASSGNDYFLTIWERKK